jgi:hypothetical protein
VRRARDPRRYLERLADLIRRRCLARGLAGASRPARSTASVSRHRRDDVAHRRVRRGLRLDPALARLSHGEAAQAAGAGTPASRQPTRRRTAAPTESATRGRAAPRRETRRERGDRCRAEHAPTLGARTPSRRPRRRPAVATSRVRSPSGRADGVEPTAAPHAACRRAAAAARRRIRRRARR